MRILAAKNGVQSRDVALPDECVEVVGDGHEIRFGWQPVFRMPPVGLREDAQLPRLDEAGDLFLHVPEVARG